MNPDSRAWLAATDMTLPRPGRGENLSVENLVKVRIEKTKSAGPGSLCFQKLPDEPCSLLLLVTGHPKSKPLPCSPPECSAHLSSGQQRYYGLNMKCPAEDHVERRGWPLMDFGKWLTPEGSDLTDEVFTV